MGKKGIYRYIYIYIYIYNDIYLLHIMCVYLCDKALTKKMIPVKWYFTEWNNIISLHGFELSNQIDCDSLVGPIELHVIF